MAASSWRGTQRLRQLVLDWPPGPVPGDEAESAIHRVVTGEGDETIAVVSSMPHPCPDHPGEPAIYLWALAVSPEHQGRGIGSRLVGEVLIDAAQGAASFVWADARESAVSFYERLGAVAVGGSVRDEITGLQDRRIIFSVR